MLVAALLLPSLGGMALTPQVRDRTGCLDATALTAQLEEDLAPLGDSSSLRLHVEVLPLAGAAHGRRTVELFLVDADWRPLLERDLVIEARDCANLAALTSAIVARRLESLPRARWRPRVVTAPAEVQPLSPPPPAVDVRPPPSSWPDRLHLSLQAGLALGFDKAAPQEVMILRGTLWEVDRPHLIFGLMGSVGAPVPLGSGQAQLFKAGVGLGLSGGIRIGGALLMPEFLLCGGPQIARGIGFTGTQTATLPMLDANLGLKTQTRLGLSAALSLNFSFITAELRQPGSSLRHREPALRLLGTVGYAWDLTLD